MYLPAPARGMWLGPWPASVPLPTAATTTAGGPACGMPSPPFASYSGSDRGLIVPLPRYNGSVCVLLFSTPQFTVDSSIGLPHPQPPLIESQFVALSCPLNSRCVGVFAFLAPLTFGGPSVALFIPPVLFPIANQSVALYPTTNTHTHRHTHSCLTVHLSLSLPSPVP